MPPSRVHVFYRLDAAAQRVIVEFHQLRLGVAARQWTGRVVPVASDAHQTIFGVVLVLLAAATAIGLSTPFASVTTT